jgi:hypothetical protein
MTDELLILPNNINNLYINKRDYDYHNKYHLLLPISIIYLIFKYTFKGDLTATPSELQHTSLYGYPQLF